MSSLSRVSPLIIPDDGKHDEIGGTSPVFGARRASSPLVLGDGNQLISPSQRRGSQISGISSTSSSPFNFLDSSGSSTRTTTPSTYRRILSRASSPDLEVFSIFDNSPLRVVCFDDQDKNIIYANMTAKTFFASELIGRQITEISPDLNVTRTPRSLDRKTKLDYALSETVVGMRKVWMQIFSPGSLVTERAKMMSEMHEIKNVANELRRHIDKIDRSHASKDPIALGKAIERAKPASEFLYNACQGALGGKNLDTYNLREIQKIVESMTSESASDKKINLKFVLSPSIPAQSKGPNPFWISGVLLNFITNAIKYSPKGSQIVVAIEDMEKRESGFQVKFSVTDQGKGMSREDQTKLFAEERTIGEAVQVGAKDQGGNGIGLSSCIDDAAKMNPTTPGTRHIGVVSELGKGSTFWFDAPFEPVSEKAVDASSLKFSEIELSQGSNPSSSNSFSSAAKPVAVKKIPPAANSEFSSLRVLVAEDSQPSQKLIQRMLTAQLKVGACEIALNGQDAYDKFINRDFNLVLMDQHMPVQDGIDSARKIRAYERNRNKLPVPIILCSGTVEETLPPEMTDQLSKPIGLVSLKQILQKFNPLASASHLAAVSEPKEVSTRLFHLASDAQTVPSVAISSQTQGPSATSLTPAAEMTRVAASAQMDSNDVVWV